MTDAPYGGLPPANDPLVVGGSTYDDPQDSTSTTDTAKDQAAKVGQTAKESGQRVAGTAAEQGKNVLAEGKTQARNLKNEVGQQAHEQTKVQKDKAASGLRSLGDELKSMVNGEGAQSGMASDIARQASDKVQELADWLESREPGDLLDEVRQVARRKPGTFLFGALAAGVVAGRLTRGAVDASRDTDDTAGAAQLADTYRPAPVDTSMDTPIATGVAVDAESTLLPGETVGAGYRTEDYR